MPYSKDVFEKYAIRYDQWYEQGEGKIFAPIELEAIKKTNLNFHTNSIEIGVGTGYFASKLGVTYGVDPAFEVLKIAKRRSIKVIQGFGEKLPIKDDQFSLVLMIVTICFVEDPVKTIKEAYRILQKKGKIVLGIVPRNSLWGKSYLEKKAKGHIFYSKAEFFTVGEIVNFLKEEGFTSIGGISTLYQKPSDTPAEKDTFNDYPDEEAGFVVIYGEKGGG